VLVGILGKFKVGEDEGRDTRRERVMGSGRDETEFLKAAD
jgi:hypothetical protein